MSLRILLILVILLPVSLRAEDSAEPAPPSRQVVLKALQWMQSSTPQRRQAAYRSVHLLGKEAIPSFRKALQKARQYHERKLADVLSGRNRGGNPYGELVGVVDELRQERARRIDARTARGRLGLGKIPFRGLVELGQLVL